MKRYLEAINIVALVAVVVVNIVLYQHQDELIRQQRDAIHRWRTRALTCERANIALYGADRGGARWATVPPDLRDADESRDGGDCGDDVFANRLGRNHLESDRR